MKTYKIIYFFPVLACLALLACNGKKKRKNDWAYENLKGNVKRTTDSIYKVNIKAGDLKKDSLSYVGVITFNNAGFILSDSGYSNTRGFYKLIHKLDANNNILERTMYKEHKITYRKVCVYDEKNNVVNEIEFESPDERKDSLVKNVSHYTYKYDGNGRIILNTAIRNGKPWFVRQYFIDTKGNIIKDKIHYAWDTGKKYSDFGIYTYDAKGNQLEYRCFDADSMLYFRFAAKYDNRGNKIEDAAYSRGDTLQYREVMAYDDRGNQTRDIDYHRDSAVQWDRRYEFKKFDAMGNWIEQVFYDKGKPETITERKIEYY